MKNKTEIKWLLDTYPKFETECEKALEFLERFEWHVKWKKQEAEKYFTSFSFRLKKTIKCVKNVFKIWPPDETLSPIVLEDNEKILETCIYVDSFILNSHAIFDNIAHIWNEEKLESKFKKQQVGLIPNNYNEEFIKTFPKDLRDNLKIGIFNKALKVLKDYRDRLSHRNSPQIESMDTSFLKKNMKKILAS